jgi:N-acyl-D-amino-acid deacylase
MKLRSGAAAWVLVAGWLLAWPGGSGADSFVITGARVADGAGKPLAKASVRVEGDRITAVGALKPKKGERVVDGRGLVLAPGFIDIHNHSADELLTMPLAETQVSQGITTVVEGPDGGSAWPIAEYLDKLRAAPPAVNVMTMAGHATIRELVMGDDYRRAATEEEIARMAALVEQAMREGAAGLSSGLEYDVGSYSATEELVAMSRAVAPYGGFYMTHTRDEADRTFEAFQEAIEIGEKGGLPVEISHIKMGVVGMWGRAPEAVALFESARKRGVDVTADCYPYEAWHSNMEVIVPNKKYDDPPSVEEALADLGGAARITITDCEAHPEYNGKTMEAIARSEGITPVELYIRMVKEGGAGIIGHSMIEKDVRAFYTQPWVMVGSDGGIDAAHPRGAGTFPRVLGLYVREKKWLTLPEAIRKMTSLPATRLKLSDRGVIREGMKADLVLFDPKTVIDRSTFEKPRELSVGIQTVWVNGEAVWENGKAPGARPGRVLAAAGSVSASASGSGNLLIVGGGPIPDSVVARFVELAGGAGKARIVVYPMASEDPEAGFEITKKFNALGASAQRIVVDRDAATDEAARKLDGVTGIWFGGGDQSRLTAALKGTPVEKAIRERYAAGAVVGGTSAGAAVMSTPMITGDEKRPGGSRPPQDANGSSSAFMTIERDNIVTREGFDLLPGAIVDQHFVRRRRHNRLISLVLEHPELVGVGIDESAALEVGPDGKWKVLGESVAVVYDARKARVTAAGKRPLGAADIRMQVLPAGSIFDPPSGQAELPASP